MILVLAILLQQNTFAAEKEQETWIQIDSYRFSATNGRAWPAISTSASARTTQVVALDQVPAVVNRMFEGKVQGRVVVDVNA
ncbi:MAG TPA: hypothetical protein VIW72_10055 [Burkholderiales bacterium]